MLIYAVTVAIDASIESEWLHWMQDVHIPDVMATHLFLESHIQRHIIDDTDAEGRKLYTIAYSMKNLADFEHYQSDFAPALQRDHTERYMGQFSASRAVMEVV